MKWHEKAYIIVVFKHYFSQFLDKDRAIAGNKLYVFPTNARRVFLKDLLSRPLSRNDLRFKKNYALKNFNKESHTAIRIISRTRKESPSL